MKNPYDILKVKKTSSQDEIKKSYRQLVKKFHPDLNPGDKKAEEKFKEITNAYDLIGTPTERVKFDRGELNEQQYQGPPRKQNYKRRANREEDGQFNQSFTNQFGSEDFFEEFFKGHRGEDQTRKSETRYRMSISFKESILGSEKIVSLPNGKNIKISIPAGITSGTKLRFSSDAILEVTVESLEGWTRLGNDLVMEVAISFIEGILGTEISIETMYGPVLLKIPGGVNTGSKLRIKGKGVITAKEKGNQIITLKVLLPSKINPELIATIKSWKGKFDYNPRDILKKENKEHRQSPDV